MDFTTEQNIPHPKNNVGRMEPDTKSDVLSNMVLFSARDYIQI